MAKFGLQLCRNAGLPWFANSRSFLAASSFGHSRILSAEHAYTCRHTVPAEVFAMPFLEVDEDSEQWPGVNNSEGGDSPSFALLSFPSFWFPLFPFHPLSLSLALSLSLSLSLSSLFLSLFGAMPSSRQRTLRQLVLSRWGQLAVPGPPPPLPPFPSFREKGHS